jgi:hypothetical protein
MFKSFIDMILPPMSRGMGHLRSRRRSAEAPAGKTPAAREKGRCAHHGAALNVMVSVSEYAGDAINVAAPA